jgi:transposase
MKVMIGVDPHKGSHTATMLDRHEHELRRITVRSSDRQVGELLAWADGVKPRMWAVESAGGMGYLLAQQLVAAGETVLDVPASWRNPMWSPTDGTGRDPTCDERGGTDDGPERA